MRRLYTTGARKRAPLMRYADLWRNCKRSILDNDFLFGPHPCRISKNYGCSMFEVVCSVTSALSFLLDSVYFCQISGQSLRPWGRLWCCKLHPRDTQALNHCLVAILYIISSYVIIILNELIDMIMIGLRIILPPWWIKYWVCFFPHILCPVVW